MTQAQISKNVEERDKNLQKQEKTEKVFYEDNPNRALEEYEVAGSVE